MFLTVRIPATFTIQAVEGAKFGVIWKEVDSKRDPKPSADYWSKDGLIKKEGSHNIVSGNKIRLAQFFYTGPG